jgi:HlyD family secretion protein
MKSDTLSSSKVDVKPEEQSDNAEVLVQKVDKKLECVFVKDGDKAKIRIIKTGIQDDSNIEVIQGLKKGDVVIVGPYTTVTKDLNSGDLVFVKSEEEKAKEIKK